jgi:hypothetical protein
VGVEFRTSTHRLRHTVLKVGKLQLALYTVGIRTVRVQVVGLLSLREIIGGLPHLKCTNAGQTFEVVGLGVERKHGAYSWAALRVPRDHHGPSTKRRTCQRQMAMVVGVALRRDSCTSHKGSVRRFLPPGRVVTAGLLPGGAKRHPQACAPIQSDRQAAPNSEDNQVRSSGLGQHRRLFHFHTQGVALSGQQANTVQSSRRVTRLGVDTQGNVLSRRGKE